MHVRKIILVFFMLAAFSGCAGEQGEALRKIEKMGVVYNRFSFLTSVKKNDENLVRLFLDSGMDVDTQNRKGWTGLMYAASTGNTDVADILLGAKASVNIKTPKGWTALMGAVGNGHVEIVKMLIALGADTNTKTTDTDITPLINSVLSGNVEITKILLEAGADYKVKDAEGNSPLMLAVSKKNLSLVRLLFEYGADSNVLTPDGHTILEYASEHGYIEIVEVLLANVSYENSPDISKKAMRKAALSGNTGIVSVLLDKGVPVDVVFFGGKTPLMCAALSGTVGTVKLLLYKGADSDSVSRDGETALNYAVDRGFVSIVKILLETGSNIECEQTWNALIYAVNAGYNEIVRLLFNRIVEVKDGKAAFFHALKRRELKTVQEFVESGFDVNSQNAQGKSALEVAMYNGYVDILNVLKDAGAE